MKNITRRQLLKGLAVGTAAATLPLKFGVRRAEAVDNQQPIFGEMDATTSGSGGYSSGGFGSCVELRGDSLYDRDKAIYGYFASFIVADNPMGIQPY